MTCSTSRFVHNSKFLNQTSPINLHSIMYEDHQEKTPSPCGCSQQQKFGFFCFTKEENCKKLSVVKFMYSMQKAGNVSL